MHKFKAEYDALSKIYRLGAILFWLLVGLWFLDWNAFFRMGNEGPEFRFTLMIFAWSLILVIVLFLIYVFSPLGYEIRYDSVIILRKIKPIIIELKKIKDVKLAQEGYLLFSKYRRMRLNRLWEIHLGKMLEGDIGSETYYRSYATCLKNAVVIFADNAYVVSPDRPDLFIQLLQERIKKG